MLVESDVLHLSSPIEFIGYARRIRKNFLAGFDANCYRSWVIQRDFLSFRSILFNHPEAVRAVLVEQCELFPKADLVNTVLGTALGRGLVTSEGAEWRRNRRIVAPSFDHRNLKQYTSFMVGSASRLCVAWEAVEGFVDVHKSMMALTLDIISQTMFSADSSHMVKLVENSSRIYQGDMTFSAFAVTPGLKHAWKAYTRFSGKRIIRELDAAIYDLIETRNSSVQRPDLLHDLITSIDAETGYRLSPEAIRDQVVTIFMAGHETTALTLTWALYLLVKHPEVQERVAAEVETVIGNKEPQLEDCPRLLFTKMVLDETLRLYPPIHTLGWREAKSDTVVAGVPVRKGTVALVSPWVLHRHSRLWSDPDTFSPERFDATKAAERHRYSYLPFSAGPRVCIAPMFALTEATLILARILQQFRLVRLASDVSPRALITLLPSSDVLIKVARRS